MDHDTSARGAELVVHEDGDEVCLDLWTGRERDSTAAGVELVEAAVTSASSSHVRHVLATLEASAPASGDVLTALRARVGGDVEHLETRRAGASVLVDLGLRE